jgi:hypothetical protein
LSKGGTVNFAGTHFSDHRSAYRRYPLDAVWATVHLAPYGFAGVGAFSDIGDHFDEFGHHHHHSDNRVMGNFGGGIEYRVTPHIGIFTEAAYDVVDGAKNNLVPINFGLKFAFQAGA